MSESKGPATFQTKRCKELFDQFPEKVKKDILSGEEMYHPRHLVFSSESRYYEGIILSELMKIPNFVAIKFVNRWGQQKSEIIFLK